MFDEEIAIIEDAKRFENLKKANKLIIKLFNAYIDNIQQALPNGDYRRIESETDNTIAILNNIKLKYAIR